MADRCWKEIPNHFDNVILDEYKVMPNHVHGIIGIMNNVTEKQFVGTRHVAPLPNSQPNRKFDLLPSRSLHAIIGSYKSAATKLIHQKGSSFAWQSRFYDHIIRNERELNRIREYIHNNPARWELDRENPNLAAQQKNR